MISLEDGVYLRVCVCVVSRKDCICRRPFTRLDNFSYLSSCLAAPAVGSCEQLVAQGQLK